MLASRSNSSKWNCISSFSGSSVAGFVTFGGVFCSFSSQLVCKISFKLNRCSSRLQLGGQGGGGSSKSFFSANLQGINVAVFGLSQFQDIILKADFDKFSLIFLMTEMQYPF